MFKYLTALLAFLGLFALGRSIARQRSPGEVLIIDGPFGLRRIVLDGPAFAIPILEKLESIQLGLQTDTIASRAPHTLSSGERVFIEGSAQWTIRKNEQSIKKTLEELGSDRLDHQLFVQETVMLALREKAGETKLKDLTEAPGRFELDVDSLASGRVSEKGLSLVSFTIEKIQTEPGEVIYQRDELPASTSDH